MGASNFKLMENGEQYFKPLEIVVEYKMEPIFPRNKDSLVLYGNFVKQWAPIADETRSTWALDVVVDYAWSGRDTVVVCSGDFVKEV